VMEVLVEGIVVQVVGSVVVLLLCDNGTPSPNGATATPLPTLCCHSHSHQVMA
jgi:hypothetical protein